MEGHPCIETMVRLEQWLRAKRRFPTSSSAPILRLGDFFSGCGGMTLGTVEAGRRSGFRIVPSLAVDMLEAAGLVYATNFPGVDVLHDDITLHVDGPLDAQQPTRAERQLLDRTGPLDIIVGGPPCQGHSDLNNHTRREDGRNDLYLRMARAVLLYRPYLAVIENVQTVTRSSTNVVTRTREVLGLAGYRTKEIVARGHHMGLPQRRVRHFTIAQREDLTEPTFLLPQRGERSVMTAIGDLSVGTTLFETPSTHQRQNVERIAWLFGAGWTLEEAHADYNEGSVKHPQAFNLVNHRRPRCHQNGHNYPAVYGRMRPNEAAPTITRGFGSTGQGRFVHPMEPRTLTPHEAARVQTVPDFFSFEPVTARGDLHTLIGNAVPPLMMLDLLTPYLGTIQSSML